MLVSEPQPTRWELRARLVGADLRIRPLFWVSCALLGVVYYQYPEIREEIGGVAAFGLWMAAVLLSSVAHELGHALAARVFGARPRIVVSGLGDQLFGLDGLRLWRQTGVALAGPLANGLLFGLFWLITEYPLPIERIAHGWRIFLGQSVWLMLMINSFWGVLNLLPLWPLDGGRLAVVIGEAMLGRRGQILALLLSLVITVGLTLFAIGWMHHALIDRFNPHYPVFFVYFCILSLYCYALWLSTFRALWGTPQPPTTG
jgi:Zn-dependent protease